MLRQRSNNEEKWQCTSVLMGDVENWGMALIREMEWDYYRRREDKITIEYI